MMQKKRVIGKYYSKETGRFGPLEFEYVEAFGHVIFKKKDFEEMIELIAKGEFKPTKKKVRKKTISK